MVSILVFDPLDVHPGLIPLRLAAACFHVVSSVFGSHTLLLSYSGTIVFDVVCPLEAMMVVKVINLTIQVVVKQLMLWRQGFMKQCAPHKVLSCA